MEEKPALPLRILRHPFTRLLLTLVGMGLLLWAASQWLSFRRPGASVRSHWPLVPMELVSALAAVIAMLGVGLGIERSTLAGLGFTGRRLLPELSLGFLGGAATLTVAVGVLAIAGWYRLGGPPSPASGHSLGSELLGAVVLTFLIGVFEEVFFRGIMFRLLEQWLGTWIALALTAAQFGFAHRHNPGATWASTVGITLEAGVLLAAAFVVTRNLWAPIGLHWAWNLFEGPLFGAPVSGMELPHLLNPVIAGPALWTGGPFGPEAGLACMMVGGAGGILLMGVAVKRGRILTPRWLGRLLGRSTPQAPAAPPPAPLA